MSMHRAAGLPCKTIPSEIIMKRSDINQIMRQADEFIRQRGFYLPPFAYWSPEAWRTKGPEAREIIETSLGWDITDFGSGDFRHSGLFLFTIRNGHPDNWRTLQGKLYAEKIMIVEQGQVTPYHFHWNKMEDIINRGGGSLLIQLFNSTPGEEKDSQSMVKVSLDSVENHLPAGSIVKLEPGESISLPPYLYHQFWAEGGKTLVGEVSLVNDDEKDNRFLEPLPRFPVIEEDEPPLYLLVSDYSRYYMTTQ
jgi:D-lyxose ketol-isomerase